MPVEGRWLNEEHLLGQEKCYRAEGDLLFDCQKQRRIGTLLCNELRLLAFALHNKV
jgi:hypothetical protein